ncbi:MAG: nucleotidyltransferase domain-containing protein [Pseudomonadota bacterium]
MNKFGLSDTEYQQLNSLVIEPLMRHGAKVWIFGSRARGDHSGFSDVDLMVEATTEISNVLGQVSETIIESNFPYKVDIVDLRDFAAEYRSNFEREKVLISVGSSK